MVLIRGEPVDSETFSLTRLHDPADLALAEATRERVHDECMAAKGFPGPPDDDADVGAYNEASFGDDPDATRPPAPQRVEIFEGTWVELRTTWTPESCRWQASDFLGIDPLVREGLRQEMEVLIFQGNQAADADLADVVSRWGECLSDGGADSATLLHVIDHPEGRNPYGDRAASCLSDDLRSEAMEIRATHHIAVASKNENLVNAWVALLDQESDAARRANDRLARS